MIFWIKVLILKCLKLYFKIINSQFIRLIGCFLGFHQYGKYGGNYIEQTSFLECRNCHNHINITNEQLKEIKLFGSNNKPNYFVTFKKKIKQRHSDLFFKYFIWKL